MSLEEQLTQLRKEWKGAIGTSRKVIEQRAKLIQWAIEKREKDKSFEKDVKDAFT